MLRKSDSDYNRLSYIFNDIAWGEYEPSSEVFDKYCAELNSAISRDFPELSVDDLWALRAEIIDGKERLKKLLGLH